MTAEVIYAWCAILSLLCFIFLFRGFRQTRSHLLLWSSLAFAFLTLNNLILFVDLVVLPDVEFGGGMLRAISSAIGGSLLLFGLIWETA